jgi:hypothetical protein
MTRLLPVFILASLTGCATTYDARTAPKTAEFSLEGKNDSTWTTLRNTFAWAFEDEECRTSKYGTRLGGEIGNSATGASAAVPIAAEGKFVFTAAYMEGRVGQIRECAVTGSFDPIPGHRYKAVLVSSEGVSVCQLGVYDVTNTTDEQIEFSMPPHACIVNATSKRENGRPLWTNYKVKVITMPSR